MDALMTTPTSPTEQARNEMCALVHQRNSVLVATGVKRNDLSVLDLNLSIQRASRKRIMLELARVHYRIN